MQYSRMIETRIGPRVTVARQGATLATAEWTADGRLKRVVKTSATDAEIVQVAESWREICSLFRAPMAATVELGRRALIWREVGLDGRYIWLVAAFDGGLVKRHRREGSESLGDLVERVVGVSLTDLIVDLIQFDTEVYNAY